MSFMTDAAFPRRALRRSGFTLIELTGVLVILALVAAMVLPIVTGSGGSVSVDIGNGSQTAERVVTQSTLQAIRDAYLSTNQGQGLWADLGRTPNRLPLTLAPLFLPTPPTTGDSTPLFNPVNKIGWRGPYLTQPTGTYPDTTTSDWSSRGFSTVYGSVGEPTFIDAWGNPVVLQIDLNNNGVITAEEAAAARLVSAGPDGVIDWDRTDGLLGQTDYLIALENQLIDDVVLYLELPE